MYYYRPGISAVRILPVPYVMGSWCFYTPHYVSLCQLFKLKLMMMMNNWKLSARRLLQHSNGGRRGPANFIYFENTIVHIDAVVYWTANSTNVLSKGCLWHAIARHHEDLLMSINGSPAAPAADPGLTSLVVISWRHRRDVIVMPMTSDHVVCRWQIRWRADSQSSHCKRARYNFYDCGRSNVVVTAPRQTDAAFLQWL